MFGSKPRAELSRPDVLKAIPRRNPEVETKRGPNGRLFVTVHRSKKGLAHILSYVVAIPRKRTYELDDRGEWFWDQCDGKNSVADLGAAVAKRWKVGKEAARQMAFQYIGLLTRRGLIAVEVSPGQGRESGKGRTKEKRRS
jgi:hypothetical protein